MSYLVEMYGNLFVTSFLDQSPKVATLADGVARFLCRKTGILGFF